MNQSAEEHSQASLETGWLPGTETGSTLDVNKPDIKNTALVNHLHDVQPSDADDNGIPDVEPTLEDLKIAKAFIDALQTARLDDSKMSSEDCAWHHNPPNGPSSDLSDPLLCLSINMYLATKNASETTYYSICEPSVTATLKMPSTFSHLNK